MGYFSPATNQMLQEKFSKRICVSVYGRDLTELRKNVTLAQTFDPGYIELRLDYLSPAPLQKWGQLKKFDSPAAKIFTFRSRREGGAMRISEKVRKQILLEIISEIAPSIIDVEISTLEAFSEIKDSLGRSDSRKTKLIVSSHNFQKTEDMQVLERMVRAAEQYDPAIIKVVRQANNFEDNLKMLSLYRLSEEIKPARLVAFSMGPLGIFSRVACVSYNSPFTYASLPSRETASGQLDIQSMKTLLDSWEMKQR
jgi:3-dehydroquinate dehydratase I